MASGSPGSRVSRETRLLLLTLLLSVIALLVLARIRFPGRPATPALVPPLLTQLAAPTPFEDLSNAVSALESQVSPSLQLLPIEPSPAGVSRLIPALRFRSDAAVTLVGPADAEPVGVDVVARDRATGLAIVRIPPAPAQELRTWAPQREASPRYLLVTEASPTGVSLRPVFVGALRSTMSYSWETRVWIVPPHLDLPRGAFVYTTTGALAGLVVDEPDSQALVPAEALIAAAERLTTAEPRRPGSLGIDVQELAPSIAAAAGVATGVVVVHVDASGPAGDALVPTDVIEAINDQVVANPFQWQARMARLGAGENIALRVRRSGRTADVSLTAAEAPPAGAQPRLGLAMRTRSGRGAEVTLVHGASIADRAGIKVGDLITRAGEVPSPSPAEVARAFEALPSGGALLVAITRGPEHLVVALTKP